MKTLVSMIVIGAMALGFVGCSGSESAQNPPGDKAKEAPGTPKDGV